MKVNRRHWPGSGQDSPRFVNPEAPQKGSPNLNKEEVAEIERSTKVSKETDMRGTSSAEPILSIAMKRIDFGLVIA